MPHITKQSNNSISSATALTNGDLTAASANELRTTFYKFTWNNANITGLSGTANTIKVCTLPAKSLVKRAIINVTGAAAGVTALTVSLGRTSTAYIDYIVASNAKAAAIYGDAVAELGSNISSLLGDIPSLSATTDVYVRFDAFAENLSAVTGSIGEIILEVTTLP